MLHFYPCYPQTLHIFNYILLFWAPVSWNTGTAISQQNILGNLLKGKAWTSGWREVNPAVVGGSAHPTVWQRTNSTHRRSHISARHCLRMSLVLRISTLDVVLITTRKEDLLSPVYSWETQGILGCINGFIQDLITSEWQGWGSKDFNNRSIFLGYLLGRIWGRAEEPCKQGIQHIVGAHVTRQLELHGRASR